MMYHDILRRPIISENSMEDIANKKYTFEVAKGANKIEIKKAVEEIFKVQVEKVTTINYIQGDMIRVYGECSGMEVAGFTEEACPLLYMAYSKLIG